MDLEVDSAVLVRRQALVHHRTLNHLTKAVWAIQVVLDTDNPVSVNPVSFSQVSVVASVAADLVAHHQIQHPMQPAKHKTSTKAVSANKPKKKQPNEILSKKSVQRI